MSSKSAGTRGVQSSAAMLAAHEQHLLLFRFHQMTFPVVNWGLKPLALELCLSISKARSCDDFSALFLFLFQPVIYGGVCWALLVLNPLTVLLVWSVHRSLDCCPASAGI